MTAPKGVLWACEEHSAAKHVILRKYLDRWLPIMADRQPELLLVDGFAGPGRYLGGEDGSPIIMLKAFLDHTARAAIERRTLRYVFVESHRGRLDHLASEIERLEIPPNVRVTTILGNYSDVMPGLLGNVPDRVPTFAFLDPFGYAETQFRLTSQILGFPRCEVLIYLPTRFIARFVTHPDVASTFDLLFASDAWVGAKELGGPLRREFLKNAFAQALRGDADHVRSFEVFTGSGGGYHLFFATNHPLGLAKMKEAMWKVDPVHGVAYHPQPPQTGQLGMFEPEPDTVPLLHVLRDRFGTEPFTVRQAVQFTELETDFLEAHLRRRTLTPAERGGRLLVQRAPGAKRGTFGLATVLRFAE